MKNKSNADSNILQQHITLPKELGGHSLFVTSAGHANPGPAIVFEAGLGCPSSFWHQNIIKEVSKFAKVFMYDRAGAGQSEEASSPRKLEHVVDELHAALKIASIPGPYILVGHSMGGLIIRIYEQKFPQEVVGMMFLDAMHEDQGPGWDKNAGLMKKICLLMCAEEEIKEFSDLGEDKDKLFRTFESEVYLCGEACKVLKKMGDKPLKNKPVTAIKKGKQDDSEGGMEQAKTKLDPAEQLQLENFMSEFKSMHAGMQKKLSKDLSHNTTDLVVVKDAGHAFPATHPEVVIEELKKLIARCAG